MAACAEFRGEARVTNWERFIDTFFKPELVASTWPKILGGMVVTLQIAALVVVTGIALGLLLALLRAYRFRLLNWLIIVYADVMRALPPLVLVLIAYFGLPNIGLTLSGFVVLWLVLSLVLAAFAEEIFWAGITSIRKGQWDAARATGLSFSATLLHIILPQAVRLTIPPLTNRTIAITKNTALGTVIGVPEILNEATTAVSFSGNATPLTLGAIAYLLIFVPVVLLGRSIERRFHWRQI
jgi:polar amino acid transport system permease protein